MKHFEKYLEIYSMMARDGLFMKMRDTGTKKWLNAPNKNKYKKKIKQKRLRGKK